MKKITRLTFIKQSIGLSSAIALFPLFSSNGYAQSAVSQGVSIEELMSRLVKANDDHVSQIIEKGDGANRHGGRSNGYNFAKVSAAYCNSDSKYFESKVLIPVLERLTRQLVATQRPDGTINAGNLESPPDTAFIMEPLCAGVSILRENNSKALSNIKSEIEKFILKTANALVVGGVHTPNHRWVICDALARINELYPDKRYVARIDEWLSEGIYMDEDGHYPERSMNYSDVENGAFITLARLLGRPELYEAPRKSLEMTYYYMEPNGDLVTVDSRRQDQYSHRSIVGQYLHYRYLAINDNDGTFAAITRMIEEFPGFEEIIVNEALFYFMETFQLRKELPQPSPPPTDFEKVFTTSSLVRIRRDNTTATIFGGVDWPLIIASGRSVSPNFFAFRKGEAFLKHLRMSSAFFSMGHFRSEGLKVENEKYVLHKKLEAPYYQPLSEEKRNPEGDYELTPSIDGRFWSKMSFAERPVSNVKTLDSKVVIREDKGKVELDFEVTGLEGVAVTLELCFPDGGELKGVSLAKDGENYFLENGTGTYKMGKDSIEFGTGIKEHENIQRLDGEMYSTHFGTLRVEGTHVYLTGFTPFLHTLTFR